MKISKGFGSIVTHGLLPSKDLPAFGLAMSRVVVPVHQALCNFFKRSAADISGKLDLIQMTMVSMDRKFEVLGLKRQESEKKIKDLEITTVGCDATITGKATEREA